MSTHVVANRCVKCGEVIPPNSKGYYLSPCKLVTYGRGGYDGTPGIGRGAGDDELRVVFPGGIRKDRRAVCADCGVRWLTDGQTKGATK